jgi:hypothetical protein
MNVSLRLHILMLYTLHNLYFQVPVLKPRQLGMFPFCFPNNPDDGYTLA